VAGGDFVNFGYNYQKYVDYSPFFVLRGHFTEVNIALYGDFDKNFMVFRVISRIAVS